MTEVNLYNPTKIKWDRCKKKVIMIRGSGIAAICFGIEPNAYE